MPDKHDDSANQLVVEWFRDNESTPVLRTRIADALRAAVAEAVRERTETIILGTEMTIERLRADGDHASLIAALALNEFAKQVRSLGKDSP